MQALSWLTTQLSNVLVPGYSAHLNDQRQKVAENEQKIQQLKECQQKYRELLGRISQLDPALATCVKTLTAESTHVEAAQQGLRRVLIQGENTLDQEWPQVKEEMSLVLGWVKFNEPGGVLKAVDQLIETHYRASPQKFKLGVLQHETARSKQEAARVVALADQATDVADALNSLAQKVATVAVQKASKPLISIERPVEVLVQG